MFFEVAKKGKNSWWMYLLTMLIALCASAVVMFPPISTLLEQFGPNLMSLQLTKGIGANGEDYKNFLIFGLLLSFVFMLLGFIIAFKAFHKRTIFSVISAWNRIRWNKFFFAFFVAVLLMAISFVYSYYSAPEDFEVIFEPQKFFVLFLICIVLIPIQASTEEILFRGYLKQGVGLATKSRFLALLIPAILFGAMHLANPEVFEHGIWLMFPLYIIMGLAFGIMTLMSDGIELAMGYHSANNLMLALFVTSPESVLQTNAILRLKEAQDISSEIIPMIVGEIIILAIFAWRYKWTNWKEKLFGKIS